MQQTFTLLVQLKVTLFSDSTLEGLGMLISASLPKALYYTHTRNLCSVHLALADSYQL
jgi:hypothetical protein